MAHTVEKGQGCVEVTVTTDIKEECLGDMTEDTSDDVVRSDLYIALYWMSHVCLLSKMFSMVHLILCS